MIEAWCFGGFQAPREKTPYIVLGAPLDATATYRPGTRFGPQAIREASRNIEFYSFRSGVDMDDVGFHDLGDACIPENVKEALLTIEVTTKTSWRPGDVLIMLGGEHTVSRAAIEALRPDKVVVFDAHLDLRDEYLGSKDNHACTVRRLVESLGSENILLVGVRACCREEVEYAKQSGVKYITSYDVERMGVRETVKVIENFLREASRTYISIDLDVLDPAYAPGVGNPEPEGLTTMQLIDILAGITKENLVGVDVVELCPPYDNGSTAVAAAKIIVEVCAAHYVAISSR